MFPITDFSPTGASSESDSINIRATISAGGYSGPHGISRPVSDAAYHSPALFDRVVHDACCVDVLADDGSIGSPDRIVARVPGDRGILTSRYSRTLRCFVSWSVRFHDRLVERSSSI